MVYFELQTRERIMCEFLGKLKYEPKTQTFPVEGLKGVHVVGYVFKDNYGNWTREWLVVSEEVNLWSDPYQANKRDDYAAELAKVESHIAKLKAHGFDDLVSSYMERDHKEASYWCANLENQMRDQVERNMANFGFPTVLVCGLKSAKQAVYKAHNL